MRAVDTNILARYYLADDPGQLQIATRLLEAGDVFVPKTVVLELAWVLESAAGQPAGRVQECLRHLVALPGVTLEDEDEIQAALELCTAGIDFADALHLCASSACTEMLTFDDRGFARRAARLKLKTRVVRPIAGPTGVAQRAGRYRVSRRTRGL